MRYFRLLILVLTALVFFTGCFGGMSSGNDRSDVTTIKDSDNDGMPDDYEIANGLNPDVHDSNDDPDGDWVRNHDEYTQDTNPLDINSTPDFHLYQWTKQIGTSENDLAYSISIDSDDNIYIVGETSGKIDSDENRGGSDLFLMKYDADGNKLWAKQWGTTEDDIAYKVVIDGSQNIIVASNTRMLEDGNGSVSGSYFTKFKSNGDLAWSKKINYRLNEGSFVVDDLGNIYGSFIGYTSGVKRSVVSKLSESGDEIWAQEVKSWVGSAYGIAIDENYNVYVTGNYDRTISQDNDEDIFLAKLNNIGEIVWVHEWERTSQYEQPSSLLIDEEGYLYLGGIAKSQVNGSAFFGLMDAFVTKLDSNGSDIWTTQWGTGVDDVLTSMALSNDGNIYVSGSTNGDLEGHINSGMSDLFVTKLNIDGKKLWTKQKGTNQHEASIGIVIDSSNSIYLTGFTNGYLMDGINSFGQQDIFISKYVIAGELSDIDGDGIANDVDNCPTVFDSNQSDFDGDGVGDVCDSDLDQDGVANYLDYFPFDETEWLDTDFDGIGNNADPDDDNDDMPDEFELANGLDSLKSDKYGDTDWDGVYNFGEYIEKTDPSDSNSTPSIHRRHWVNYVEDDTESIFGEDVLTDSSGNIYIVGSTTFSIDGNAQSSGTDIIVMKYDADENRLWSKQWGSTANDEGLALAIDGSDNIYVGGYLGKDSSNNSNQELFVAKLDSDGTEIWTKQFGTLESDKVYDLATDASGNIYMAGITHQKLSSEAYMGGSDAFIAKLDSTGDVSWAKQWGSNIDDNADGVFVASNGSIYVTGSKADDIYVYKFDSDGNQQATLEWGTDFRDGAKDILVDGSGLIYVTGYTYGALDDTSKDDNISDIFVSKLDDTGKIIWSNQWGSDYVYQGNSLVMDAKDYIYITGIQSDDFGFLSKLDNDGNRIWNSTYNIRATIIESKAIAMYDNLIYMSGSATEDERTRLFFSKYYEIVHSDTDSISDASDNCPTINNYDQADMDNDNIGDVCDSDRDGDGTSNDTDDFPDDPSETLDTDGDGIGNNADNDDDNDGMWDGYENSNGLDPLVDDTSGDADSDGVSNYREFKEGTDPQDADSLPLEHELKFTKQLGSTGTDQAYNTTIDENNNTYIVGRTNAAFDSNAHLGSYDVFVVKYDALGIKQWSKQFGTGGTDEGYAIVSDNNGYIYVAGITDGDLEGANNGSWDSFLTKLSSTDGSTVWHRQWGTSESDFANDLTMGYNGYILVVGQTEGVLNGENLGYSDAYIYAYDSSGNPQGAPVQWGTDKQDVVYAVATDSENEVYMIGSTKGAFEGYSNSGADDIFVTKLSYTGTILWTQQWGTSATDTPYDIALNSDKQIVIAGTTSGAFENNTNAGSNDIFVTQLENNGSLIWTQQYGTSDFDEAKGVVVDELDNIYVSGYTENSLDAQLHNGSQDYFISKFDSTGTKTWTQQFGSASSDTVSAIAIDEGSSFYVTGSTMGTLDGVSAGAHDSFVSKFVMHHDTDGIEDIEDNCPYKSNLTQDDSDGDGIGDVCDN